MKTSLKRIQTKDGIELVGLLYEPDKSTKRILVHVHGMAGNFYENKFLDSIAKTLTSNGIAFFAFNNRGCEIFKDLTKIIDGKKTYVRYGNAYEKFEDCLLDIEAAIDAATEWGFEEIHLSGHSLGSPKVAYYLAETQDSRITSVLFMSPSSMLGLVRSEPERFARDVADANKMVKEGKGRDLIPRPVWDEYPLSAETFLNLFGDASKTSIFNLQDPKNGLQALGKISQPMFAVMGRQDDALVISIEDTMARIKTAAKKGNRVETCILGEANHGYDDYEDKLAEAIYNWISTFKN